MGLFRNQEVKKMFVLMLAVSAAFTAAGAFLHPLCGLLIFCACMVLLSIEIYFTKTRYCKIAALSCLLNRVLHGEGPEILEENEEGELWILQSEARKMALALREQAELLKKDKLYLADALSDISHQLKTPLTSMNLIASLLQKTDISRERQEALLREMNELLRRMEWLVSSLLKMSRMDAGTVHFQMERCLLQELVLEAAEPLSIPMEIKELQFSVEGEENAALLADRAWTVEALGNVLKNCLEHTPQGGSIRVALQETPVYTSAVMEDTGVGISQTDLPHIFERFYQSSEQKAAGNNVGIGLALTRMIVTKQGGTVQAENRREGGCRFVLKFYKHTL